MTTPDHFWNDHHIDLLISILYASDGDVEETAKQFGHITGVSPSASRMMKIVGRYNRNPHNSKIVSSLSADKKNIALYKIDDDFP